MREFSIIKQKILQYLEFKGISKYKFYQETGITNGILSQTNGLSEENILKSLAIYRDISLNWLFYGEGPMLRSDTAVTEPSNAVSTSDTLDESGTITALRSIIKEQAKEIARLEIELDRYRTSSTVGEPPLNGQD